MAAPASDPFNTLGLAILNILDTRHAGLYSLMLCLPLALVKRTFRGKWPGQTEWLRGVLGIVSLFGAISILCIFLLTDPPAMDKLSDESRDTVGLVAFIMLAGLGLGEIWAVFFAAPRSNPET